MNRPTLVPPLKCQGIKTKLVPAIQRIAESRDFSRWVEPFCGSCVVAVKSGQFKHSKEPDNPPEAGSCLTCIARPTDDLVLDA